MPCREEQCCRGKAVRGGGAGQGAPSLLSMFTLLLISTPELPLPVTIFSGKCRICVHGLTLVLPTTAMLPTAPPNLPWPGTPVHIPNQFLHFFPSLHPLITSQTPLFWKFFQKPSDPYHKPLMDAISQPSTMGTIPCRSVGAAPQVLGICASAIPQDAELVQH